jgi:hypothetical protein
MKTLALVGTSSIQDYIFRSNKLKENTGASYAVASVLNYWKRIPEDSILFIGGGNAALLFDSREDAISAVRVWSRKVLTDYPGIRVVAAYENVEGDDIAASLLKARKQLFHRENLPPDGWELGAFPVVRECASTGLAATQQDQYGTWLSAEAMSKRTYSDLATVVLEERYKDILDAGATGYDFPLDFEQLGMDKGASQIAIVHIDGNGFGKMIAEVKREGDYAAVLKLLSTALTHLGQNAMKSTIAELIQDLPVLKDYGVSLKQSAPATETKKESYYLPIRPIVDEGDDTTFVCHGKIGLRLAAMFIRHLERLSKKISDLTGQEHLSACAGVLIVPQKFPFARGYQLAEALTSSAKRARNLLTGSEKEVSWIDFQIITEGSPGSLADLRSTYARNSDAQGSEILLQRPYYLPPQSDKINVSEKLNQRNWDTFEKLLTSMQSPSWPRNRSKSLSEALARGRQSTEPIVAQYKARGFEVNAWYEDDNPFYKNTYGAKQTCSVTPLFDALEAMDYHITAKRGINEIPEN